ncbi:hypothetical protein Ade02nite_42970 [Paractinoplanes deccanensis]|uniref:Amino acid permease n=1 Tax=Paractinoplanes deccanensis TaxID=113561 RepID=A0ABQ3Y6N7_9ACTN|nr:hypothetical protein [Actinoplanes deccanensis]GID75656.1 hypothetical protein Ade02nite_42970 [Actinoplanes deccanensis]
MSIEAWQICIVVTAAIVLIESGVYLVRKKMPGPQLPRWWRTVLLGLLLVLSLVVFVVALGPSMADQLSSVAAAVAAVGALYLAYRSYNSKAQTSDARTKPEDPDHPTES